MLLAGIGVLCLNFEFLTDHDKLIDYIHAHPTILRIDLPSQPSGRNCLKLTERQKKERKKKTAIHRSAYMEYNEHGQQQSKKKVINKNEIFVVVAQTEAFLLFFQSQFESDDNDK